MREVITVTVNGRSVTVSANTSVAVAIMIAGIASRQSVCGEARGPLCGMGICFECRAEINGKPYGRSCQTPCESGMEITTDV